MTTKPQDKAPAADAVEAQRKQIEAGTRDPANVSRRARIEAHKQIQAERNKAKR